MKINARIKMLMEEKNMSQKELARLAGITEASMSKYISGTRTPRIDVIANISRALGVTADDLIGNTIESSNLGLAQLKVVLARGMETMKKKN